MSEWNSVIEAHSYLTKASRLMNEAERSAVVDAIAQSPVAAPVIRGSGGLRKARIPLAGRGKRGGGRVIYWYHSPGYPVVLLWVFAKNEADDLTDVQRKQLATIASSIVADLGVKK